MKIFEYSMVYSNIHLKIVKIFVTYNCGIGGPKITIWIKTLKFKFNVKFSKGINNWINRVTIEFGSNCKRQS